MLKDQLKRKLVMTILARNEEDIIDQHIKFHLSHGVDFFIATDNGSTDKTKDIFLKYQEKGVLHLIEEKDHNYNQDKWVDKMIKIARKQYDADWIINSDADEFWYSDLGNLKLALPYIDNTKVLFVCALHSDPVDYEGEFKIPKYISGKASGPFKCMFAAKGYKKIYKGNHNVKMFPFFRKAKISTQITIFHFSVRSYNHYKKKIINGAQALERNPRFNYTIGAHIRQAYEEYKKGNLRKTYDEIKQKNTECLSYIKQDSRLSDYVVSGYKSMNSSLYQRDFYNGKAAKTYSGKTVLHKIKSRLKKYQNYVSKLFK